MSGLSERRNSNAAYSDRKPRADRERLPAVTPARLAAAEILLRVGRGDGHSDDLLHGPVLTDLSQEDRNLTTALVLGTLRWQIALDARLKPLLARPDEMPAEEILLVLRLGAFQLLYLDRVPAHAGINESVELVRVAGHPKAAGMVNAVLRKLSVSTPLRQPLHEPVSAMAQRLGHPAWLAERWAAAYGRDAAVAVCEFNQQEPSCTQIFSPSPAHLPVMDDGSRLVAELAAIAGRGAKRIWDCCAAPGGKTIVLAHRHPSAEIVAMDSSSKRLKFLAERLARELPESRVETVLGDASQSNSVEGEFDLILCDVPCSGTGTLARNPEIRHQLQASELPRQAKRQRSILSNALRRLANDGRLVYSTCSLEKEECEQVVAATLADNPEFEMLPIQSALAALQESGILAGGVELSACIREGMLRTLPGFTLQADGFFAAVLARRSAA